MIELSILLGVLGAVAGWGAIAYLATVRRRRSRPTLLPPEWPQAIGGSSWAPRNDVNQAGPLRASHADRERTAAILRQAMAEGYLSVEELDERLGATFTARHLDELDRILADLPGAPRPSAPSARSPQVVPVTASQPLAARRSALPVGVMLLIAWVGLGLASHPVVLPGWPVLLIGFLLLRRARRARRF